MLFRCSASGVEGGGTVEEIGINFGFRENRERGGERDSWIGSLIEKLLVILKPFLDTSSTAMASDMIDLQRLACGT